MPTVTAPAAPSTAAAPKLTRTRDYTATGRIGKHLSRAQELKAEIDRLTAELSTEREFLLAHMESNGLKQLNCGDFQVQRRTRNNWDYSPFVKRELLRVDQLKKDDINDGKAINNPTVSVAFVIKPTKK